MNMTKSIDWYCNLLTDSIDESVEIVLCGNGEEANVFHTDRGRINALVSLIKVQATKTVDLKLVDLSPPDIFTTLTSGLAESTSIKSLSIHGTFFGDDEMRILVSVLNSNCGITKLVDTKANLSREGMHLLRPFVISGFISLSTLTISLNQWADATVQELTEALLLRETNLDVLEVTGVQMEEDNMGESSRLSSPAVEMITQVEVHSKYFFCIHDGLLLFISCATYSFV